MAPSRSDLKEVSVRMTGKQHAALKRHLFPSDGLEAVAILLAARHHGADRHILTVHRLIEIPYDECSERDPDHITWSTRRLLAVLQEVSTNDWAVLKIHSHPGDYGRFSLRDDASDKELFASVYGWVESDCMHGSLVMRPSGELFGRGVTSDGVFVPFERITVTGDDIRIWFSENDECEAPEAQRRHAQAFGSHTLQLLAKLRIGVVGCSGTGGPVVEQLARFGVGHLVLVDPDVVEEKNLNRIPNTTWDDAAQGHAKVSVMKRAVEAMGLGTQVITFQRTLEDIQVVRALAGCDVVFGCMDTVNGRAVLNRLATYYLIPYFDIGVRLVAASQGGVSHVCGTVHFLQPDGTSLWNRGVVDHERLRVESLREHDPEYLDDLLAEGYIQGAIEERPAVVSVNTLFASFAVNELLARLHPYRLEPSATYAMVRFSLEQMQLYTAKEDDQVSHLWPFVGRGDTRPLLGRPRLSE